MSHRLGHGARPGECCPSRPLREGHPVVTANEARSWARGALRGIGDSLYTPFCGTDGDDIDWDAYRTLVRYCVSDLGHPMLWCTSGLAEFWALTLDERKRLLELAIEEGRRANPDLVIQACITATSAKDCLDLTLHAQHAGADIAYIQTPMTEAHGGEGVLRFFSYVASRTDIALGMFNSPSSGYVLTAAEGARIYDEIPAVCATKEGAFRPESSRRLHELAPDLVLWECDRTVYRAGWLRAGIVCPAQLGTAGYLFETPQRRLFSEYWDLVMSDRRSPGRGRRDRATRGPPQAGAGRRADAVPRAIRQTDVRTHLGGRGRPRPAGGGTYQRGQRR